MNRCLYMIAAAVSVSMVVLSCSKVGGGDEDPNAIDQSDKIFPVITVSKPVANQVYMSSDSIIVQGKTTDDRVVYKGKVLITNDATNAIVSESYYESHSLTAIDFRVAYKPAVAAPTDFTVFVEFQDHGLNTVSASIKVKVNP